MPECVPANKILCIPDTWPQTRMPKVAAKPKAKLTVRNMPWEPPLKTSWATAPQPNIWRQKNEKKRDKERKREKKREKDDQGKFLSICIQFSKRKTKYIGRNARNLKKWLRTYR